MINSEILIERFEDFPVNRREVLRYANCFGIEDENVLKLVDDVEQEIRRQGRITFNICYRVVPLTIKDNNLDFTYLQMESKDLAWCLKGCESAVLIAATIGQGIDRLIRKYNTIDSARALFMQAFGAERIETMLDYFCANFADIYKNTTGEVIEGITARFSPGYGDLPLAIQPDFLKVMDASRKIGITINDSLLMSPSKSVTAIAGIKN